MMNEEESINEIIKLSDRLGIERNNINLALSKKDIAQEIDEKLTLVI
jgi:hypothetical protein